MTRNRPLTTTLLCAIVPMLMASCGGLPPEPNAAGDSLSGAAAGGGHDDIDDGDDDDGGGCSKGHARLHIRPDVYPQGTLDAYAAWTRGAGAPGSKDRDGLVLRKSVPTGEPVAALGDVTCLKPFPASSLALGFDYNGYCGGGAPRWNVLTSDGAWHFLGCFYGQHSAGTGPGWTRVRFTAADLFPPANPSDVVTQLQLAQDEGTDLGSGQVVLDNVQIGSVIIGARSGAK